MRANLILGKTIEEANVILKDEGCYFVSEDNTMHYINQIPVRLVDGVITEVWQMGKWRTDEGKDKETR